MTNRSHEWAVTIAAAVMILAASTGFGAFGTEVERSAGGAFATDATLLTPASWAFSIWSLIYLCLLGYVVWQWTARGNPVIASVSGLVVGSMLLNALWLVVAQLGWVWGSVVVILALAVDLGLLVQRLGLRRPATVVERILVDGTFGIYLGWVSVASVANVTTALVSSGVRAEGMAAEVFAVAALALAAGLGALLAFRLGGRWAVGLAMTWALAGIAIGRLTGELQSVITAVAAIAAGLIILAATAIVARRPRTEEKLAEPATADAHP